MHVMLRRCFALAMCSVPAACADVPVAITTPAPVRGDTVVWQVDARTDPTAITLEGIAMSRSTSAVFDSASNDLVYGDPDVGAIIRRSAMDGGRRVVQGGLPRDRGLTLYGVASDGTVLYATRPEDRAVLDLLRSPAATETGVRVQWYTRVSPNLRQLVTDTTYQLPGNVTNWVVTVRHDLGSRMRRASDPMPFATVSPHLGISDNGTVLTLYWLGGTLLMSAPDGRTTAALPLPQCQGSWENGFSYCGEWFKGWDGDTAVVDHIECADAGDSMYHVIHRRARVPGAAAWSVLGSADLPACPRVLHARNGRTMLAWQDPIAGRIADGDWKRHQRVAMAEWDAAGLLRLRGRVQTDRPVKFWRPMSLGPMQLSPDGQTVLLQGDEALFIGRVP